jgi:hypothetical protein
MDIDSRFEHALAEPKPSRSLYALAEELKQEGMSQLDLYKLFDRFREIHHHDTDETKYDAILDTMDYIYGWGKKLFETDLKL